MRSLNTQIKSFLSTNPRLQNYTNSEILKDPGLMINSYEELIEKISVIAFNNPEFVFLFRGQSRDHSYGIKTNLYPKMFRAPTNYLKKDVISDRYNRLNRCDQQLVDLYDFEQPHRIRRNKILRWAILQHYEICDTPLLDVTYSSRVACSFALRNSNVRAGYLYILGLPQISGSITTSSENGIQILRLLNICPPKALRPHYQDAYVIGEYPTIDTTATKQEFQRSELDFSRRLLAKFRLNPKGFRKNSQFPLIDENSLLPNAHDELYRVLSENGLITT